MFLKDQFLPRLEWPKLRLSFKKLRVFVDRIRALGVTHEIDGIVRIVEDRIKKIASFPAPKYQTDVRSFIGTVGMTRRWVNNFGEIARQLNRLMGKVEWR